VGSGEEAIRHFETGENIMNKVTLAQALKKAKSFKDIGQTDIYLFDGPYPWAFVVKVEKGCSYRLNACTSLSFKANHPSGLSFRWSVDIEPAEANGRSYFMMNPEVVQEIITSIPDAPRKQLKALITESAEALEQKADEWEGVYKSQRDTALAFRELVKLY
jgi:hypothetical protein